MSEVRDILRTVLPNGLVIISEPMTHVRSVSVGVWIGSGSRAESAERNGICHFIEHMVFKGTERRTAEEIARSVDSVGGMLDAFTSKEMVCFNTKVLDEHLPMAFEVLADLVLRPRFDPEDIEKEKGVILEEIKMDEDNPDYLIHEMLTQSVWAGHPLGRPILGTKGSVSSFSKGDVLDTFRSWYRPDNILITAAGRLDHRSLVQMVAYEFSGLKPSNNGTPLTAPKTLSALTQRHKQELEQVHLCIGVPALPLTDAKRYSAAVLNTILGGGMSSRLFQNIREKQGLAYAVFSEMNPFRDTGLLTIYAGTALERAEQVIQSVMREFRDLKEKQVSEEELRRAKDHLKGSLMLSLESTGSRMSNLARQEMYFGRFFTLDEILAAIESVTRDEVQALAQQFFQPESVSASLLGNLNGFKLERAALVC